MGSAPAVGNRKDDAVQRAILITIAKRQSVELGAKQRQKAPRSVWCGHAEGAHGLSYRCLCVFAGDHVFNAGGTFTSELFLP